MFCDEGENIQLSSRKIQLSRVERIGLYEFWFEV